MIKFLAIWWKLSRVLNSLDPVSYSWGHDNDKLISRQNLTFCFNDVTDAGIHLGAWRGPKSNCRWMEVDSFGRREGSHWFPTLNSAKTMLVQSVSRLVQYREKLRRRLATEKQSDGMFKVKYTKSTNTHKLWHVNPVVVIIMVDVVHNKYRYCIRIYAFRLNIVSPLHSTSLCNLCVRIFTISFVNHLSCGPWNRVLTRM